MKLTTTTNLLLLYVLSLLYGWTLAIDDSSLQEGFSDPREQPDGGKRAYKYKYKKLPLFLFGLGKRTVPSYEEKPTGPLNSGLGERKAGYVIEAVTRTSCTTIQLRINENGVNFGSGKREVETDVDDCQRKKRMIMEYAKAGFPFGLYERNYAYKC